VNRIVYYTNVVTLGCCKVGRRHCYRCNNRLQIRPTYKCVNNDSISSCTGRLLYVTTSSLLLLQLLMLLLMMMVVVEQFIAICELIELQRLACHWRVDVMLNGPRRQHGSCL